MMLMPKINSVKQQKLMTFSKMIRNGRLMINLGMLLLTVRVAAVELAAFLVLVAVAALVTFLMKCFPSLWADGVTRRSQQSRKGADLRYDLEVTLEQAFDGDTQKISIPVPVTCDTCDGSGAAKGSKPVTCNACGGHGKVRAQQGFFSVERTCPSCQGQGETISKPCSSCGGQGRIQKIKT